MSHSQKMRKPSAEDALQENIERFAKAIRLSSPSELLKEVQVPTDIAAALSTGRPEIISLIRARAMSAEEVGLLYKLIAVLIETNTELKNHTSEIARMVGLWTDSFKGLASLGSRIERLADFDTNPIEEESENEDDSEAGEAAGKRIMGNLERIKG